MAFGRAAQKSTPGVRLVVRPMSLPGLDTMHTGEGIYVMGERKKGKEGAVQKY